MPQQKRRNKNSTGNCINKQIERSKEVMVSCYEHLACLYGVTLQRQVHAEYIQEKKKKNSCNSNHTHTHTTIQMLT